jgi:hypothetical protein
VNEGELFAFAGLWDGWKDGNGNWLRTCAILTTTPNSVTSAIHDRMPVILDPDSYDLWLDPGMQDTTAIFELLKPFEARLMRSYPVSSRVNHVVNDDALSRLSPHRTHESNWLKALLCALGLHRWYSPTLTALVPQQGIRFCRWCPAVKVPRHDSNWDLSTTIRF